MHPMVLLLKSGLRLTFGKIRVAAIFRENKKANVNIGIYMV